MTRYALTQVAELVQISENTAIRQDKFRLIGVYPTIEAAEIERNKFFDRSLYVITQVW